MISIKSILLLFIISPYYIFSQETFTTSVIELLQKNQLIREKVFIHLNKTNYFPEDNIWFTTYVVLEQNNTPSVYTTNLHVNLLNNNGDVIDGKEIFIKEGVGFGDFLINKNYPSGKYYIHGFTNYMQNFGKENVFIQEINIINPSTVQKIKQEKDTNNYDIQLFPESGYLLEDADNTIGIKALINGNGHPFSGKITNSKGLEVTTFQGNLFGMGKCSFNFEKNETYTAIIKINDTIQKIGLPKAKRTGIIFSLDNTNEQKIKLTLKTNKETLPSLKDGTLNLLFYRNNFISEASTLSLIGNEVTTQELFFEKSKMLNGVNIATLFKNNQPIAERKFFIDKSNEQTAILIEELKAENDSINFKIKTINSNNNPITSQLSISILPKNSMVFYEKQNIKSAFLLSPYVKGQIENPSFYFKNDNAKEKEYLDLLLLNQGWNTYSLEEKINEINPKELYAFESGFTINGKTTKYPKGYDIGLLSKQNRFISFSKFDKNDEFSFKNIFAFKNDTLKLSLIKKDKSLLKPHKLILDEPIPEMINYNFLVNKYAQKLTSVEKVNSTSKVKNYSNYKELLKVEQLDEITLKTIHSRREKTQFELNREIAHNRKIIGASFYKGSKVNKDMEVRFESVISYLIFLGYVKGNTPQYITLGTGAVTFSDPAKNPDGSISPSIYINDQELEAGDTAFNKSLRVDILNTIKMQAVDEIYINKIGGGSFNTGGSIRIYLKKGNHKYLEEDEQKLYEDLILLTGFDRANNYYKPYYNIYSKEANNLIEIDWKNNLQTNQNGEITFKVPKNEFSNEFQFIINGFSENGLLFYTNYKTGEVSF